VESLVPRDGKGRELVPALEHHRDRREAGKLHLLVDDLVTDAFRIAALAFG